MTRSQPEPEADTLMGGMSMKQLLILLNDRVSRIDQSLAEYQKDQFELKLKVKELETQIRVWAIIAATGGSFLVSFLNQLIFKNG